MLTYHEMAIFGIVISQEVPIRSIRNTHVQGLSFQNDYHISHGAMS